MAGSRFPNRFERFVDTRKAGSITLDGVQLEVDKDGCIEAPFVYADTLASHGFLQVGGEAHTALMEAEKKAAAAKPAAEQQAAPAAPAKKR